MDKVQLRPKPHTIINAPLDKVRNKMDTIFVLVE